MKKRLDITVVTLAPGRNRQGADLAKVLADSGYGVTLIQPDRGDTPPDAQYKVSEIPLLLRWGQRMYGIPGASMFMICWALTIGVLRAGGRGVIALHFPCLVAACIVSLVSRRKVIYYAVEVSKGWQAWLEGLLCRYFCAMVLGVEENRLNYLRKRIRRPIDSGIIINAPRRGVERPKGGALRADLRMRGLLGEKTKIVLYHGSYQRYSRLEKIVEFSKNWEPNCLLILMIGGNVPDSFHDLVAKHQISAKILPPVAHRFLYDWVADADIGLLPYEDEGSFEVRYCSPQKLFDFLACGVPFLGSKRPLIEEVARNTGCGISVNMIDEEEVVKSINSLLADDTRRLQMGALGRRAYEEIYNYEDYGAEAFQLLDAVVRRQNYK